MIIRCSYLVFMIFIVFFPNVWVQLYIRNQDCADLIFNVIVFPCCLNVSLIMVINLLLFRGVFLTHFLKFCLIKFLFLLSIDFLVVTICFCLLNVSILVWNRCCLFAKFAVIRESVAIAFANSTCWTWSSETWSSTWFNWRVNLLSKSSSLFCWSFRYKCAFVFLLCSLLKHSREPRQVQLLEEWPVFVFSGFQIF